MVVKELITNQKEIKGYPFDQYVSESTEVDLFLFDDHLLQFNRYYSIKYACTSQPCYGEDLIGAALSLK